MTTQGTEARRGETVGLDAKRDGPFGAADAPQLTDNAETIMTDVQQAVPVAQELREVMPGHWSTSGGLAMALATLDDPHMARSRERISDFALANEVYLSPGIANLTDAKERIRWLSASLAVALLPASLPCKSGEGAGEIGDFVMVPRKLTDDMLEAVVKLDFTSSHDPLWPEYWAAMLDAAPTVPDATQTREAEGGGAGDRERGRDYEPLIEFLRGYTDRDGRFIKVINILHKLAAAL